MSKILIYAYNNERLNLDPYYNDINYEKKILDETIIYIDVNNDQQIINDLINRNNKIYDNYYFILKNNKISIKSKYLGYKQHGYIEYKYIMSVLMDINIQNFDGEAIIFQHMRNIHNYNPMS